MTDYGKDTAAPSRITLGGVDYRVAKQGPRIWGELTQFLKSFVPDPRLKAKELCAGMSDAVALEIWREFSEEAKDWPPDLESFEGNRILTTTHAGAAEVVFVLLSRHNRDITREKAWEIAADMTTAEVSELIRSSMPEPDFDPKSPAPNPTETDRGPVPA